MGTGMQYQVCPSELSADRQREAVLARCRVERIEPPGRMNRILGAANRLADQRFCTATVGRRWVLLEPSRVRRAESGTRGLAADADRAPIRFPRRARLYV
jgi:hypothetical protein